DLRNSSDGAFVLEQSLHHANGSVIGRAGAVFGGVTVPTAVCELLTEKTAHEAFGWPPEVRAKRERAAIDARLDFTREKRLGPVLLVPSVAGLQASNRRFDRRLVAVYARRA